MNCFRVHSASRAVTPLSRCRDTSETTGRRIDTRFENCGKQASLRSALTRLRGEARNAVDVADLDLNLSAGVVVDIRESKRFARRLLEPDAPHMEPDATAAAVVSLSAELLPDWYEDWVLSETTEWRQLRLHALEAMADNLTAEHRWAEALDEFDRYKTLLGDELSLAPTTRISDLVAPLGRRSTDR